MPAQCAFSIYYINYIKGPGRGAYEYNKKQRKQKNSAKVVMLRKEKF
jgi:hypothetical protein